MLNQLRQIAIFATTVKLGSFRNAADVLHLSPSVISHHISKLEEELGVALLYRSTRKLSLTSDGKKLLVSAQSMIESAETFFSVATKQSTQLMGELTVALPAVLQQSDMMNHIADFAKTHSNVALKLDFSDVQRDLIHDGVDLAIRMGWLEDSGLKARKLYDIERGVVASAEYYASKTEKISLEAVEAWDWIELSPVGLKNVFIVPASYKGIFRPKSNLRVNSAYAIRQLVASGAGLAALPLFLVKDELASGKLVRVLPEIETQAIDVHAVWPPNAPKGGLTSRFVEHLIPPR